MHPLHGFFISPRTLDILFVLCVICAKYALYIGGDMPYAVLVNGSKTIRVTSAEKAVVIALTIKGIDPITGRPLAILDDAYELRTEPGLYLLERCIKKVQRIAIDGPRSHVTFPLNGFRIPANYKIRIFRVSDQQEVATDTLLVEPIKLQAPELLYVVPTLSFFSPPPLPAEVLPDCDEDDRKMYASHTPDQMLNIISILVQIRKTAEVSGKHAHRLDRALTSLSKLYGESQTALNRHAKILAETELAPLPESLGIPLVPLLMKKKQAIPSNNRLRVFLTCLVATALLMLFFIPSNLRPEAVKSPQIALKEEVPLRPPPERQNNSTFSRAGVQPVQPPPERQNNSTFSRAGLKPKLHVWDSPCKRTINCR